MALPGGMNPLTLGAILVLGLGVLLHIVGLATPEWQTSNLLGKVSYGLFEFCSGQCVSFPTKSSELEACEAFAILGMLASFVALALAILIIALPLMGKSSHKLFPLISAASSFAAFACILLTIIIYAAAIKQSGADIGYSFALSLVGGILLAVGGVLIFLGSRQPAAT